MEVVSVSANSGIRTENKWIGAPLIKSLQILNTVKEGLLRLRQSRVALTLGCAPVAVGERAGLPWQQHSEQVGRLYRWRPRGPPRRSSAASQ